MPARVHARARVSSQQLSEALIRNLLMRFWPRRNRYHEPNCTELLAEADFFDINTYGEYRALLLRHRKVVVKCDRAPLDALSERAYRGEYGDAYIADRIRRQYFFAVEGLTRVAFEVEFGDRYAEYQRTHYRDLAIVETDARADCGEPRTQGNVDQVP